MTQSVADYFDRLPATQRAALQRLRRMIAALAPQAVETISTRVPAFYYKGKYLVSLSATENHLALLVMQGDIIATLADDLTDYETGRRIIRFKPDNPLPEALVKKIVRLRCSQIDAKTTAG